MFINLLHLWLVPHPHAFGHQMAFLSPHQQLHRCFFSCFLVYLLSLRNWSDATFLNEGTLYLCVFTFLSSKLLICNVSFHFKRCLSAYFSPFSCVLCNISVQCFCVRMANHLLMLFNEQCSCLCVVFRLFFPWFSFGTCLFLKISKDTQLPPKSFSFFPVRLTGRKETLNGMIAINHQKHWPGLGRKKCLKMPHPSSW